jgi:hypothetical protein
MSFGSYNTAPSLPPQALAPSIGFIIPSINQLHHPHELSKSCCSSAENISPWQKT